MINKKADVFSKFIIVEPHHLDELKHVNNGVYVKWIQEIAREHWLSKNPSVNSDTAYWVVMDHHIQYKRQARLKDKLKVETYVEPPQGARFPRIVNFFSQDKLIVTARTIWCWIDGSNHRPKRIPADILAKFIS